VIVMGAATFETYRDGADVSAAFRNAVEEAGWEYGHGGYTGTIAEKDDYVIITRCRRTGSSAEARTPNVQRPATLSASRRKSFGG
jgi:hypothetical protein